MSLQEVPHTTYRFGVNPNLPTVTQGGVLRFRLRHNHQQMGLNPDRALWVVVPPDGDGDWVTSQTITEGSGNGPREFYIDVTFDDPGTYRVACAYQEGGRNNHSAPVRWITKFIRVRSRRTALISAMRDALDHEGDDDQHFADPHQTLATTRRYRDTLIHMAEWQEAEGISMTSRQRREHDAELLRLSRYCRALDGILDRRWSQWDNYLCMATYAREGDPGEPQALRLFLSKHPPTGDSETGYTLVDWTNPLEPTQRSAHSGTGDTDREAIDDAVDDWFANNRYPAGRLFIKAEAGAPHLAGNGRGGDTDGETQLAFITRWLDIAATGAAIVAGVVTMVAPVPGSRFVSACIWGAIFASSAAAGIRIYERHVMGEGRWQDDAMDGLTIVANLCTAGTAGRWRAGGEVVVQSARGAAARRFLLIGQFGADGTQGVLLIADRMDELTEILHSTSLSPQQRTDRLLTFFGRAAMDGAMLAVSLSGTRQEMAELDAGARQRMHDLETGDGEALDAVNRPPSTEAETAAGETDGTIARATRPPPINEPPARTGPRRGPRVENPRRPNGQGAPELFYDCGPEMASSRRQLGYEGMESRARQRRMREDMRELRDRYAPSDPFDPGANPHAQTGEGVGVYGEMASYRLLSQEAGMSPAQIEFGEANVAAALGIDYPRGGNRPPMTDLMATHGPSRQLIPIEIKNQHEVSMSSAMHKFRHIAENAPPAIRRRIDRFEIIANLDSRLPDTHAVTEGGALWSISDGRWSPVLIDGLPVHVRRGELGPMAYPARGGATGDVDVRLPPSSRR